MPYYVENAAGIFISSKSRPEWGWGPRGRGNAAFKVDPVLWTRQPLCVEQCGSVFVRCHVAEAFLVSAVSVVVYVIIDSGLYFLVAGVFVK